MFYLDYIEKAEIFIRSFLQTRDFIVPVMAQFAIFLGCSCCAPSSEPFFVYVFSFLAFSDRLKSPKIFSKPTSMFSESTFSWATGMNCSNKGWRDVFLCERNYTIEKWRILIIESKSSEYKKHTKFSMSLS